jgi:hypothetical protein
MVSGFEVGVRGMNSSSALAGFDCLTKGFISLGCGPGMELGQRCGLGVVFRFGFVLG